MRYLKSSVMLLSVIILLIMPFVIMSCGGDGGGPSGPKLPADPGPGNLAGIIVGTINERSLAGVTVSVGSISTTTDADGIFRLDGVGEGTLGVVISGDTIYTRTAAVNTANGRSVLLDAIEVNSGFNLEFYRELARGNHPNERHLYQTHRWTTQPVFIIDTDASMTTDGVIDQNQINTVRSVLSQVVSVFTRGLYSAPSVRTQPFTQLSSFDDVPNNAFLIAFDDSLIQIDAYGLTLTQPDFLSPTTSTINKTVIFLLDNSQFYQNITFNEVIAHESGHGFGFRHTSLLPSVMVKFGEYGGLYSPFDQLHMRIMYSRPAGNTDIDNDPVPGAKMAGQPLGIQVHIDRRANFPKPAELMERIESLPRSEFLSRYVAEYK